MRIQGGQKGQLPPPPLTQEDFFLSKLRFMPIIKYGVFFKERRGFCPPPPPNTGSGSANVEMPNSPGRIVSDSDTPLLKKNITKKIVYTCTSSTSNNTGLLQCCHGLVAPKKYKKSRKKVRIVPQKSTKKVRLQDLTHSNFLFKSH